MCYGEMARLMDSLTLRHIKNILSNTQQAILLLLTIVLVITVFYFVKHPISFLAVVGTSMNPVLNTGDLITNEEILPSEVAVGDIIVYRIPPLLQKYYKCLPVVAHRVIEIKDTTTGLIYRTRGDNNPSEDPWSVRDCDLIGRVGQQIPYLGFPILFLQSSSGRVFALITGFLFALNFYASTLVGAGVKENRRYKVHGRSRTYGHIR